MSGGQRAGTGVKPTDTTCELIVLMGGRQTAAARPRLAACCWGGGDGNRPALVLADAEALGA